MKYFFRIFQGKDPVRLQPFKKSDDVPAPVVRTVTRPDGKQAHIVRKDVFRRALAKSSHKTL